MTSLPALIVAERLLDPAAMIDAVGDADAASLSHGLAGTALLHARLSTVDPTFATAATDHWTQAGAHLRRHPTGFTGIHGGHGGLAASLIIGSTYLSTHRKNVRASTALSARWLAAQAVHLANQHCAHALAQWHVYDAITGLAGAGRVLLAATQHGHTDAEPGLTAALTTLTGLLAPSESTRPGWWLPAEDHPAEVHVDPSGAATTGLAHGVAGPLAFLATAHLTGWSLPGQTDAIRYAATWLLRWRHPDGTWPPYITGAELDTHTAPQQPGRRDAWCYGTPGIARALTLAGTALDDPTIKTAGRAAIASIIDRGPVQWDVEGPTLCHGHAGVLQSAPAGSATAALAATAVTASFDPRHRFAFQHRHHNTGSDEPGVLTGAAGVALALADHSRLPTPEHATRWDALLLLS